MADPTLIPPVEPFSAAVLERRAAVRRPFQQEVFYQPVGEDSAGLWPARVHDLSATGMGLIVTRPFEKGAALAVELQTDDETLTYTLLVYVMWSQPLDESNWFLGCALARPLSEDELTNLL